MGQRTRHPHIDFIDVTAREESAPKESTMVQLPAVPAYALTIHKVQSLTMLGKVLGCLEGIFAHGQLYVLVSRVTDPQNLCFIGLPPVDMLDEVAAAWVDELADAVIALHQQAAAVRGSDQGLLADLRRLSQSDGRERPDEAHGASSPSGYEVIGLFGGGML